ncbi:hypothetical protein, partial [Faecalibaculum rodentium]
MIFDTWYTLDPGADVCTMTCPKTGTGTAGSGRSESGDAKETARETQSATGPVPAASAQSTDSPASPKEAGVEARPVQVSIRSLAGEDASGQIWLGEDAMKRLYEGPRDYK